MSSKFTALALTLLFAAAPAARAIPDVVTYAARVENTAGPFSGTASVTFELFGQATGGARLWTESLASVVVVGGDLVHDLGSITPFSDAVLERDVLFLQVTLDGETVEPRASFGAVPYALHTEKAVVAANADRLGGQAPASFRFTAAASGGLTVTDNAFSIAPGAVTTARLADGAVTSEKVASGAVGSAQLADASVGEAKLANSAVTASKLASAAVSTAQLADASVTEAKLANNAVTTAKLVTNAVTSAVIGDGQVNTVDLANVAVTNAKVADGAVTGAKIASRTVATSNIAFGAVTGSELANSAVSSAKLSGPTEVFRQPLACGGNLQQGTTGCRALMCNVVVSRDQFNTILDVTERFFNCAGNCTATTSATCSVTSRAGFIVAN